MAMGGESGIKLTKSRIFLQAAQIFPTKEK
jgi:hypothetical protein